MNNLAKHIYIILREFRTTAFTDCNVLFLYVFCIVSSCIIMYFSFGMIHHLEQKNIDAESAEKCININFYDNHKPLDQKKSVVKQNLIQKGELIRLFMDMDERVFDDCSYIELIGKYEDDVVEDPSVDIFHLAAVIHFVIRNGKICVPPGLEKMIRKNGMLKDGKYFDQSDYDQKRRVCLAVLESAHFSQLEDNYPDWKKKYSPTDRGTYIIDGNEYNCIGHFVSLMNIPLIPATVMRDDVFVMSLNIEFNHVVSKYTYDSISSVLKARYGDAVKIKELELRQADYTHFNNTMIIIMILIISLSLIILSILNNHFVIRRSGTFRVFKICGMTNKHIAGIILSEANFLIIFSLISGTLIYHFIILPYMNKSFEYLDNSARINVYITVSVIYLIASRLFFKAMLFIKTKYYLD